MHYLKSRFNMLNCVNDIAGRVPPGKCALAEIEFPCTTQIEPDLMSWDLLAFWCRLFSESALSPLRVCSVIS
jgi:hypothetical protein